MRAILILVLALLFTIAYPQPTLLIFPDSAPPVQHNNQPYNPNIDMKPHLTPFLEELRKVQVEWYSPNHPTARAFAERRGLSAEQLANPTPALRGQLARAWGATYVMTVRCTRPPEKSQYEYRIVVWELGKRAPVWESDGFQQLATGAGRAEAVGALQTLARTVAMRLDSELWASLPRVAEPVRTPTPAAPPRENPPPPADPKQQAGKLLGEGKHQEALLPLRAAVNTEPMDPDLRLQLIRLYRRLNLTEQAQQELQRAVQLFPNEERFALEWAQLLREAGNSAAAVARLQEALQVQPESMALRLALFDLLLEGGDPNAAARALQPIEAQETAEVEYRRYLLRGAKRELENLPSDAVALTEAQASLWLQIASGLLADLASELLDLRRLTASPNPNWAELRPRAERAVLTALSIGRWLEKAQPNDATRALVAHARFASQMLAQSAQHMARYVLSRKQEEEERASLLRIEAMRELEAAKNALPKRSP
ncbi:MAG: tetratricopeptide repeat protein [Fimbriimonadales bacterium]|nr:tetratricopeptide repeat protein [Fimbriimonadales bacterium]